MKPADLKALSGSFIFLVASVCIAILLWAFSSSQANRSRVEKEKIEFVLDAARARLLKTGSERHVIEDNLDTWQRLEKRGFASDSQRLAWLEAITNANRQNQLYGLDYTLSPAAITPPEVARGLPLKQTTMHIRMPLLVEQDLTRFLDGLKSHPAGLMRAKSCTLELTGTLPPAMVNKPGLEAECELLWYTLEPAT